jgi:hypothetical protein
MRCPHCTVGIKPELHLTSGVRDAGTELDVESWICPECDRGFVTIAGSEYVGGPLTQAGSYRQTDEVIIWPRSSSRPPVSADVPEQYASLAREAGLILADSPRASAAMARRSLQQILRDEAGAPPGKLYDEIEWTIKNAGLPSHASESLHALREIANFAAHPNKSTSTGDYLEVEPGEAEWTLDVLDTLFDHYFVGPARTAKRKADLAARLGKTP